MNVSSVSNTQSTMQMRRPSAPPDMQAMFAPVASKLGMSDDELKTALRSGTTLLELAADKGVARDDLLSALKEGIAAAKPEGAPELSVEQIDEMAEAIASGNPPPRPDGAHGGPGLRGFGTTGENLAKGLGNLADQLGLDIDALLEQLANGTSLSDLLEVSRATHDASPQGNQVDTYL